ncbi:hypothetical protein AB0P02_18970 [Streptomyces griseoluteus]|uniref:hypothetical protein n=1 Tax=Streptomyces griseoluteus TaxID=29306 RepID=UPI003440D0FF
MLTITVERHAQDEEYFSPWFDGHYGWHFHHDDITAEGADALAGLLTQQVRLRWRPRPSGAPRGPRIPSVLKRRPVMPYDELALASDQADGIVYLMRADLITARGAEGFIRALVGVIPHWKRLDLRRAG